MGLGSAFSNSRSRFVVVCFLGLGLLLLPFFALAGLAGLDFFAAAALPVFSVFFSDPVFFFFRGDPLDFAFSSIHSTALRYLVMK